MTDIDNHKMFNICTDNWSKPSTNMMLFGQRTIRKVRSTRLTLTSLKSREILFPHLGLVLIVFPINDLQVCEGDC